MQRYRPTNNRQFFKLLLSLVCLAPMPATGAPVQRPELLKKIEWLETSWFASPAIYDLDGDGSNELVGTYYSIYVWDKHFNLLDKMPYGEYHHGRIYAPAVIADLDADGVTEIVAGGSDGRVAAYEWRTGRLSIKAGWPVVTYDGKGMRPEVRSLAAADLDHDGTIEVIAANTQTDEGEPQVYVLSPDGHLYQPPGISWPAWPRYNRLPGLGNDLDANGAGNRGYGCFGENIGVGDLDDDPELEIVVTFDNHQINVFDLNGVSHAASSWFLNRSSQHSGQRLNWGQFIRWLDPAVEENHYHLHTGAWPSPENEKWLQWTDSPPNVVDVNGDGKAEVLAVANAEKGIPYDSKHQAVMVLEGSYGDGGRSARRLAGWENLPVSEPPQDRGGRSWYPPTGIPAPTTVNITGDARPEIVVPMNDGAVYLFSPDAARVWRRDITHGGRLMYASEVLAADLNQDGQSELVFTTYGDPDNIRPGVPHGYLMILGADGSVLHDIQLPEQGENGNGKGAPAAPTLGDLDDDGDVEIIVQTFDGHLYVYSVPGSAENLMLWPTGRGGYLRQGRTPNADLGGELRILSRTLPDARGGKAYTATLAAAGGTPPYRWELAAGAPPPGLSLAADGKLSGTPNAAGRLVFTVRALDAASLAVIQDISLNVLPAAITAEIEGGRFVTAKRKGAGGRFSLHGTVPFAGNPLTGGLSATCSLGGVPVVTQAPLKTDGMRATARNKNGTLLLRWNDETQALSFRLSRVHAKLSAPFRLRRSPRAGILSLAFSLELGELLAEAQPEFRFRVSRRGTTGKLAEK